MGHSSCEHEDSLFPRGLVTLWFSAMAFSLGTWLPHEDCDCRTQDASRKASQRPPIAAEPNRDTECTPRPSYPARRSDPSSSSAGSTDSSTLSVETSK
jgi:hypothetical protein